MALIDAYLAAVGRLDESILSAVVLVTEGATDSLQECEPNFVQR